VMRDDDCACRLLSPRIGSNMAEDFIILAVNYRSSDMFWTPRLTAGHHPPAASVLCISNHFHGFQIPNALPA